MHHTDIWNFLYKWVCPGGQWSGCRLWDAVWGHQLPPWNLPFLLGLETKNSEGLTLFLTSPLLCENSFSSSMDQSTQPWSDFSKTLEKSLASWESYTGVKCRWLKIYLPWLSTRLKLRASFTTTSPSPFNLPPIKPSPQEKGHGIRIRNNHLPWLRRVQSEFLLILGKEYHTASYQNRF